MYVYARWSSLGLYAHSWHQKNPGGRFGRYTDGRNMGPQHSLSPFFTLSFPGCPLPVRVSSALVGNLEELVRQTDTNLQGVLCGSASPTATEVQACRPVGAFTPDAMGRAARERDVVGFYRVRDGESMELSDTEEAIADRHFAGPGFVVLLIQRSVEEPQANFFFRENGKLLNVALLTFALNVVTLRREFAPVAVIPEAVPEQRRTAPLALIAGVLAVAAAGAGGTMLLLPRRARDAKEASSRAVSAAIPAPTATAALPLRAERQGGDLKIVWDLDTPAIATAVSGVLDIDDGGAKRRIPLDTRQVRFGSLLYTPHSDEVSIDFTALKEDGSAGQASVLVLLAKPAPGQTAAPPVRNVAVALDARRGADRAREAAEAKRPVMRAFVPPPPREKAAAAPVVENLPVARMAQQGIAPLPLPGLTAPGRPGATTPAQTPTGAQTPLQTAAPAAPPRTSMRMPEEKFTPPEILSQAGPRIPSELRSFVTKPFTVSIRAEVDATGRVIRAIPEGRNMVHAGFVSAAVEAATQCRFRPARRGDKAVSSQAILTFRFQPDAH